MVIYDILSTLVLAEKFIFGQNFAHFALKQEKTVCPWRKDGFF